MSYFEDQQDAWFANDCKGKIEDYGPEEIDNYLLGEVETKKDKKAEIKKLSERVEELS